MSIAVRDARSDNVRGIVAMLVGMAAFVVCDSLMKIAAGQVPPGEALFLRGVASTAFGAALIAQNGQLGLLSRSLSPRVLLRALVDLGSTATFLAALVHMPMAEIFGLLQFVPLAVTAGAALFMGAKVGWRRWTATCVGLVGVLIIVQPGTATFAPHSLLAIISVMFSAARDLLSRAIPASVTPGVIVTVSSGIVTLACSGFALFESWRIPEPLTFAQIMVAAAMLLAGHLGLVAAMRTGEIAVVAPFRYSIILWAIFSGFLVWGEVPDLARWIGIAIVTAAGLYTFLRERQLAKAMTRDR